MRSEEAGLALSIVGSRAGLAEVAEAFERFSALHRVPDAARRSIQVVLDELLSNTVRYGRREGEGLTVDVAFRLEAAMLRVEITDDGMPFNPLEAPDPDTTLPLEERPVGHLGLMLVRDLVDQIAYEREGGRNRVRLGKLLDS